MLLCLSDFYSFSPLKATSSIIRQTSMDPTSIVMSSRPGTSAGVLFSPRNSNSSSGNNSNNIINGFGGVLATADPASIIPQHQSLQPVVIPGTRPGGELLVRSSSTTDAYGGHGHGREQKEIVIRISRE
jgi:hypothetical protein